MPLPLCEIQLLKHGELLEYTSTNENLEYQKWMNIYSRSPNFCKQNLISFYLWYKLKKKTYVSKLTLSILSSLYATFTYYIDNTLTYILLLILQDTFLLLSLWYISPSSTNCSHTDELVEKLFIFPECLSFKMKTRCYVL